MESDSYFSKEKQLLSDLKTGVAHLLRQIRLVQAERETLRNERDRLEAENQALRERVTSLEMQAAFKSGDSSSEAPNAAAQRIRGELNRLIHEVDLCLEALGRGVD